VPPKCRRFTEIIPKISADVSKGFSTRDTFQEGSLSNNKIRVKILGFTNKL
jgi:hypothetical protein